MVVEVLPPDAAFETCPHCGHRRLILKVCECGHREFSHELASDDRRRTWCTVMTGAEGKCPCRKFQSVGKHREAE